MKSKKAGPWSEGEMKFGWIVVPGLPNTAMTNLSAPFVAVLSVQVPLPAQLPPHVPNTLFASGNAFRTALTVQANVAVQAVPAVPQTIWPSVDRTVPPVGFETVTLYETLKIAALCEVPAGVPRPHPSDAATATTSPTQ